MISTLHVFWKQIYKNKHFRKEIYLKTTHFESSELRPVVPVKESMMFWESFSEYKCISSQKIPIFFLWQTVFACLPIFVFFFFWGKRSPILLQRAKYLEKRSYFLSFPFYKPKLFGRTSGKVC